MNRVTPGNCCPPYVPMILLTLKPAARYPASVAASSIWKSKPVKLAGVAPLVASSQTASTCANETSGLASVASTVAWAWLKPTVTIVWQPSSRRRWMFAA